MTDIHDLVPKNKFDSSNIERLKHLADNEIEPILPSLLEWIQDCNWPVAGDILPVLALHQSALVPLIHRVLSPHEKTTYGSIGLSPVWYLFFPMRA